jgi:hypothetical protein
MNDAAYLPAAASAGSAIGGLTSLGSAWPTQRYQDRAKRLLQDKGRRQSLYKQFIIEASKLYADALSHRQIGHFSACQCLRPDQSNAHSVEPRRGR